MNLIEFKSSMRTVFQSASPPFRLEELRALFFYLDTDRDGRIGPDEFVTGVKGQLNAFRRYRPLPLCDELRCAVSTLCALYFPPDNYSVLFP